MNYRSYVPAALGVALIPCIWWVAADLLSLTSPVLLPPFLAVLNRLWTLGRTGTLSVDFQATIARWLTGFSAGVCVGVAGGVLLGMSKTAQRILEFPVEFFRAMPVTAIFPLYLIVFGVGDESKVAMAFTPTVLLMLVNTMYGVSLAEPARRRMARVFGATYGQVLRYVVMRDALPQVFVGLRLAVSLSLVVTVVSEMFIGTDFGLGQRVYDSYLTNSVPTLYALLVMLGLLGYVANKLVLWAERRVVFWTT